MPQSLRSILGTNRVHKSSTPKRKPRSHTRDDKAEEKLADVGTAQLLEEELTLRDVVQAMRYIRRRMFCAVPPTGMGSRRTAEVVRYREAMPPVVTVAQVHAMLGPPSRVEREVAELWGKGVVRRVRVGRRGAVGEALIEAEDMRGMVVVARSSTCLSEGAASGFLAFLEGHPTAQMMEVVHGEQDGREKGAGLTHAQADELVRAGFLTMDAGDDDDAARVLRVRPEDRTTLTSVQRVSRFASGTVLAVGGRDAVHLAGGGGGAPALTCMDRGHGRGEFRIAVPGHGRHLRLAEGAVGWLRGVLEGMRWGEATEDRLRERFEGGVRWREFWGVEWEWLLGMAVGLGVVELFDTGSVGRGVRVVA